MPLNEDTFDIGGSGIDTQYERDYINYRPTITYTPPSIDSSYGLSADTTTQSQSILTDISGTSVIDTWQNVVDTVKSINQLEITLSDKLKDVSASIPSSIQPMIQKAAEDLGYHGVTNSIPFALYKKTFENPPSPSSILIQDAYEDYMSDVEGSLNGEIYADVAELQSDWNDMLGFVQKGLFAQLVPMDAVPPTDVQADDTKFDTIKAAEKQINDEYAQLLQILSVDKQIYYQLSDSAYGTEQYFQALHDYEEVKRRIKNIEKRLFTKAEIVDLVNKKASDTNDNVSLLQNTVDFDPFEGDRYELLYGLMKQFKSRAAMLSGFKKMKALLKLSIDGKKQDVKSMRETLRGMAGGGNKRKINKMLVNGIHLRNEIHGEVYDIMNNLDGIPNNENFDILAGHITDGVKQSEKVYRQQASDFYKVHAMDANVRLGKVGSLIDKDAARHSYKLLDAILNYTENVDTAWPDDNELSTWLDNFMSHNNMN